jgi:hypothetical protein
MTRRQDWPERLAEYVEARIDSPFAWGTNDCVTFAMDAVQLMTGVDPIASIRGTWDSPLAAVQAMEPFGGTARGVVTAFMGESIDPRTARRGDVVLVENGGREVTAVCIGSHAAGPGVEGLLMVPMVDAIAAWEV